MDVMWSGHLGVQSQCKGNGGCLHPSSFQPSLGLPRIQGHWAPGSRLSLTLPSELMLVPFETYIIEVTLITDTVKLLVPPLWSDWIRMSCDWLWMNLGGLTSFDAQVKSAHDNMLLPSGYLLSWPGWWHNMLFCFATHISQGVMMVEVIRPVNMLCHFMA